MIFASFAFSKSSLNIWKFLVHVLLKPGLENSEHYFTSMWDECNNCASVWPFFGIAFLWDLNQNWYFPVLKPGLNFPNVLAHWVQDFEPETPVLWLPYAKSWLIRKQSDTGRDWGQEEKGTIDDEMARLHHRLDGHEFKWTQGVADGQGGLACCDSWGRKESDTTERLNWTEFQIINWSVN